MSYSSQASYLEDLAFWRRARQAIQATAINVQGEAASTAMHYNRGAFAQFALKYSELATNQMLPGIVSDDLTSPASADTTMQTRIANVWNAYASITT